MEKTFLSRIVTTTTVFPRRHPAEDAIDRIAAAGFDAIDMGLDYWDYGPDSPFMGDGYVGWASCLRERAEALGVPFTHSHAPGGADCGELIGRSLETAAALGAGYMVLHPVYHDEERRDIDDPELFIKLNAALVEPWLDKAEKLGVTILSENLQYGASADPRVVAELAAHVGSPRFGWCWDTGHAHCSGFAPEVLRECAAPPLSLHLHDNDASGDDHLIPGDGTIDWKAVISVLRETGYAGDCVLEAHSQCKKAPDDQRDAVLRRLCESGKKLRAAAAG